jgi:hypothetical protein
MANDDSFAEPAQPQQIGGSESAMKNENGFDNEIFI